jgi:hypothetical protein
VSLKCLLFVWFPARTSPMSLAKSGSLIRSAKICSFSCIGRPEVRCIQDMVKHAVDSQIGSFFVLAMGSCQSECPLSGPPADHSEYLPFHGPMPDLVKYSIWASEGFLEGLLAQPFSERPVVSELMCLVLRHGGCDQSAELGLCA